MCWKWVEIQFGESVKAPGVNDWSTLCRFTGLGVAIDNEDWVRTGRVVDSVCHSALLVKFVENLVNDFTIFRACSVRSVVLDFGLPSINKQDPHPSVGWDVDSAAMVSPEIVLFNKIAENPNCVVVTIDSYAIR